MVTLDALAAGLAALGYEATVAGLGGNIVGVEVTTARGYRWVISADDLWYIGRDDAARPDDGPAAAAELSVDADLLVGWADQLMGFDRGVFECCPGTWIPIPVAGHSTIAVVVCPTCTSRYEAKEALSR